MKAGNQLDLFRVETAKPAAALESVAASPSPWRYSLAKTISGIGNLVAFSKTASPAFWDGMKLDD